MKPAQFTSLLSFLALAVVVSAEHAAIQRDGLISFQPSPAGGPRP